MAPVAPFFAERLYSDLNKVTGKEEFESVHLAYFPNTMTTWLMPIWKSVCSWHRIYHHWCYRYVKK
jgi:isoleucyl-tRNA synthetase